MYTQKRGVVKQMSDQLESEIQRKESALQQQLKEKELKRESIRQMALRGKHNVESFKQSKVELTRQELKQKTEEEKKMIYRFEKEAQQLEALEEQLIRRLQAVQEEEKAAFKELELVMIQASLPRRERLEVVAEEDLAVVV